MEILELLRNCEIFQGLSEKQLGKVRVHFDLRRVVEGEYLFHQGEKADKLYLVKEGFFEVMVQAAPGSAGHAAAHLGPGQSIGEMPWVDRGRRSGSVRAISPGAEVASITFADLDGICGRDSRIGYQIMRNIAVDLSFRLRQLDLVLL